MTVGGGVHGKGTGIDLITMIQDGAAIEVFRLFMHRYLPAGEMTIGNIAGEGIAGITNMCRSSRFNKIGEAGKNINTGRSKIRGAFQG